MSSNDNKSNVVILDVITTLDVPPERILKSALEADLDGCIIVGCTKDGEEYFSASIVNGPDLLWMLERAKKKLIDMVGDV